MITRIHTISILVFLYSFISTFVEALRPIKHVILIGIDGMDVGQYHKVLNSGGAPNLKYLRETGTHTDKAHAAWPTDSLGNWVYILSSIDPGMSGIHGNDYDPREPFVESVMGRCTMEYPTVFKNLRLINPSSTTASFHSWNGISDIVAMSQLNHTFYSPSRSDYEVYFYGMQYFMKHKPEFTFLYFGDVDEIGHAKGYAEEYLEGIRVTDKLIGMVLEDLKKDPEVYASTAILVVSDHGRQVNGFHHGGFTTNEMTVSWTAWAAPEAGVIKRGHVLQTPVVNGDTAPTVMHLLGYTSPIYQPLQWRGRPVYEILENAPEYEGLFTNHVENKPFAVSSITDRFLLPLQKSTDCINRFSPRTPIFDLLSLRPFYKGHVTPLLTGIIIGVAATLVVLLVLLLLRRLLKPVLFALMTGKRLRLWHDIKNKLGNWRLYPKKKLRATTSDGYLGLAPEDEAPTPMSARSAARRTYYQID